MRVCRADGETPLPPVEVNLPFIEYPDIMIETKLTIIVSSDANGYGDGGLFIRGTDRDYGILSGRDFNEVTLDWEGSRFPAVGDGARVYDWEDDFMSGFDLYGHRDAVAGDWFIIDYTATNVGNCNVEFYDYSISWYDPNRYLVFSHVRTRDFDDDTIVNFVDFAVLASYWQETGCSYPNWCEGTDLDTDGIVDVNDLMLFCEFWIERTK